MTESDRLFLLNARTVSEATHSSILIRKLSRYWSPRGLSHDTEDIRLSQAGLGLLDNIWYPAVFLFSIILTLVFSVTVGSVIGAGVFFCSLYFFLFRIVTYLSIERRIKFGAHLGGFVRGLEMCAMEGRGLASAFEFVLERAPEGVLRTELSRTTARGNLKSSISGLPNRVLGREAKVLSSSIFLMTGIYDLQQKGVKKISDLLSTSLKNMEKRVQVRRLWYKIIFTLVGGCVLIDTFVLVHIPELLGEPVVELIIVSQLLGVLLASEFADRIVGSK